MNGGTFLFCVSSSARRCSRSRHKYTAQYALTAKTINPIAVIVAMVMIWNQPISHLTKHAAVNNDFHKGQP